MSTALQYELLTFEVGVIDCAEPQEKYLRSLLTAAEGFLRRRGVELDELSAEDDVLTAAVAAWMYRARGATDRAPLPRNLDIQIKDRICAGKMRARA